MRSERAQRRARAIPFRLAAEPRFSDDEREALAALKSPDTRWYASAEELFADKGWNG